MQLHMRIRIFGCGPLAAALTGLAERAGHTVWRSRPTPLPPYADELLDLVILAGDRSAVDADLAVYNASRAWDQTPCSIDAANAYVKAINALVTRYRSNSLQSITLVGTTIPSSRC